MNCLLSTYLTDDAEKDKLQLVKETQATRAITRKNKETVVKTITQLHIFKHL